VFRGTCDAPGESGAVGGCAQLTGAPPPPAIGKVPTTTGSVTVRDASGVVAQVEVGDSACRHDVVETGADGAVGVTFTDGTAFKLLKGRPHGTERIRFRSERDLEFSPV
jgi:hypothetical protein